MSRTSGVLAALKAVPGGRHAPAPQSGGRGAMNSVAANAMYGNPNAMSGYGQLWRGLRSARLFA
jgi:hypothetical protein